MPQARSSNIDTLVSGLKTAAGNLVEVLNEQKLQRSALPLYPPSKTKQDVVSTLMHEVERRYGISPGDLVERKLLRIFEPMTFEDLEEWSRILLSPLAPEAEWLSLVECLTVHETYFDRDKEQLRVVLSKVLPAIIERKRCGGDYRLRIWSAACSSGEEAYNLAFLALMALKNAGLARELEDGSIWPNPGWTVDILGSDVSSQVIRRARSGVYPDVEMGPFRSMDPSLWRFFEDVASPENRIEAISKRVCSPACDVTRFCRHNLMEPLGEADPFDLIFCRNTMIYFGSSGKSILQGHLVRNLAPGGVLMLGATDVLADLTGLTRHRRNGSFWYQRDDR